MILALRLLCRRILLNLLLWLHFFHLVIVLILFLSFFDGLVLVFLLSEIKIQCVGIVLVDFTCHIVKLVDIGSTIEQQSKQRMLNLIFLVLQLLLDGPYRLIFLTVVLTFDAELKIFEIISLFAKFESDPHVIGVMVEELALEEVRLLDAVYIDLFGQ